MGSHNGHQEECCIGSLSPSAKLNGNGILEAGDAVTSGHRSFGERHDIWQMAPRCRQLPDFKFNRDELRRSSPSSASQSRIRKADSVLDDCNRPSLHSSSSYGQAAAALAVQPACCAAPSPLSFWWCSDAGWHRRQGTGAAGRTGPPPLPPLIAPTTAQARAFVTATRVPASPLRATRLSMRSVPTQPVSAQDRSLCSEHYGRYSMLSKSSGASTHVQGCMLYRSQRQHSITDCVLQPPG